MHKIYAAGMFVVAGFIVGFDTEKDAVAEAMIDCIEATGIPIAMVGLLTALPNTQLTRRLEREGRLLAFQRGGGDQCTSGLNFVTLRPRRDVLADFRAILTSIYDPAAYFARVRRLGRVLDRPHLPNPIVWKTVVKELRAFARTLWAMNVSAAGVAPPFLVDRHRLRAPQPAQLRADHDHVGDVPAPRCLRAGPDRGPRSSDRGDRRRAGGGTDTAGARGVALVHLHRI